MEFAGALLALEPEISRASLEGLFGPKERWVTLKNHIPVHIMYFTLRVDADGTIRSYGDVYGHNKKLIELLNRVGFRPSGCEAVDFGAGRCCAGPSLSCPQPFVQAFTAA